jgi:hypothetical protein
VNKFIEYAFFRIILGSDIFGKYTKTTFGNVAEEKAAGGCGRSGWDSGSWVFPPSSLLGRIQLLAIIFRDFLSRILKPKTRRAKMAHKYRKN